MRRLAKLRKFTKTVEDFSCGRCETSVKGDGYTNHCPKCLTSRHVDVNPGDRSEICGGLMTARGLEIKGGICTIIHVCDKCSAMRKCRTSDNDSQEALRRLSAHVL